jgi:predicted nucleic acid-binding protein
VNISERLQGLSRVFLDSAPVIYYVESHPSFTSRIDPLFERLDAGTLRAVVSPVTIAECLVRPFRDADRDLHRLFLDLFEAGPGVACEAISERHAVKAAEFRAAYGLRLLDSWQVVCALSSACEALITNDRAFLRVKEIPVIMLGDLPT